MSKGLIGKFLEKYEKSSGISSVLATMLLFVIVFGVAAGGFYVISQLIVTEHSSQAGFIIDENENNGIVEVQYISEGNSDYVVMKAEHFEYNFTQVGERIQFAGQELQFISHKEGSETLFKTYEPSDPVENKVKLPGEFGAGFVTKDDTYSAIDFELTNPYGEVVEIESVRVDALRKQTTMSHLSNEENVRPDKCPDNGPSPERLCTLILLDSVDAGWVTKNVSKNLPVMVGKEDNFDTSQTGGAGGYVDNAWEPAVMNPGETYNFSFYRFQYSKSDNQITDTRGEVMFVTLHFSNGKTLTFSDTVENFKE